MIDALLLQQDMYSVREYLRERLEPERLMWLCVILTALNDAVYGSLGKTTPRTTPPTITELANADEANQWFDDDDFIAVCSYVGLPPIGLRHACRGIIAQYHNTMNSNAKRQINRLQA